MRDAYQYAQAGGGGKLARREGGYWVAPDQKNFNPMIHIYFPNGTVEALVKRGAAEYTAWKKNKAGKFPVEVTMKEIEI